ncbi:hypothetical protein FSARC_12111 [Fusarium sarcochroum]|uniref:Uncharacterized protein n=1 Tax=Fusarium sarcochroum TaxID=1208366 RepID=A0A8H4WXJ2_9HYPO|nr:hypothetical protein FSARC_12111 [Fusarium sarcochroum]
MGQDNIPMEGMAPSENTNTDQNRELILPNSFTIHKQAESETKFNVRGNPGSSPLSIVCSYKNNEDDFEAAVVLQTDTGENARPLAAVYYSRHSATLELNNTTPTTPISMRYQLLGDRNAVHQFSIDLSVPTSFEWKNTGDGTGWKLFMISRPEEILATGVLNMGSDKPPRFELTNLDVANELGEKWKLAAIASWIRIWDKVRIQFARAPDEGEAELALFSCGFCVIL